MPDEKTGMPDSEDRLQKLKREENSELENDNCVQELPCGALAPTRELAFSPALAMLRTTRSPRFKAKPIPIELQRRTPVMAKIELGSRSAASLAMLLVPFIAQAQATFDLSSIARPGDAAAVPPELG